MNSQPTTKHYALTKKQRDILNLLYRFRFGTSDQISQTLHIHKSVINKRLQLMLELKYIGRRYEPEYRLLRKYASYYLLADGVKALKQLESKRYSQKVLRNIGKDDTATDQFVNHWLTMFDLFLALKAHYGDDLQFFTRSQIATATYFPKQLPDAHIQLGKDNQELFLLDLLHQDQPFFLATRRIVQYIDYANRDDGWPSSHKFPKILLVCDSSSLQKRLIKRMQRRIEEIDNPDLEFFITSLEEVKDDVWYGMAEPDEVLPLSSIS